MRENSPRSADTAGGGRVAGTADALPSWDSSNAAESTDEDCAGADSADADSARCKAARCPEIAGRPLRRDAERNRQRILTAAWEAFNARGLEVSLDEIARYAGVGVGTVYRRFGTKEELVEALFVDRIDSMAACAEEALQAADPWSGLASFIEQMAGMMAGDLGLRQMLMFASYGQDLVAYARRRNAPLIRRLVERAQASGQLRGDLKQTDIPFLIFALAEAAELGHGARPGLWRRYLTIILDGLRSERDDVTPLPVAALRPEEMENSMQQAARRNR